LNINIGKESNPGHNNPLAVLRFFGVGAFRNLRLLRIARITNPGAKKTLHGFYFTIAENIILDIPDDLVICGGNFVNSEGSIALDYNTLKFHLFKELRRWPASLFELRKGKWSSPAGLVKVKPSANWLATISQSFFSNPSK